MIEHHVYWALVGARWVDTENFAKGPAHFFDGVPEHLREKLREDAQWEMPPLPAWFAGRQAIGRFLASQVFGAPRAWRMVPTRANGQP